MNHPHQHALRLAAGQEGAGVEDKAIEHINTHPRYQRSVRSARECRPESLERGANPGSTLLSCRRRGGVGGTGDRGDAGIGEWPNGRAVSVCEGEGLRGPGTPVFVWAGDLFGKVWRVDSIGWRLVHNHSFGMPQLLKLVYSVLRHIFTPKVWRTILLPNLWCGRNCGVAGRGNQPNRPAWFVSINTIMLFGDSIYNTTMFNYNNTTMFNYLHSCI